MKDEHREKLDNRLTPLHLYKLTPKTNCGECGFATCLAFATQAIVGQVDLDACPYLPGEELGPFRLKLSEQHEAGIGLKREGFEKALQFLRQEIGKWNFKTVAASLGATLAEEGGRPALKLHYFHQQVTVTHDDVVSDAGGELSPYEKILLFNYVIGGAGEPSGEWVGMESLPNSVSKIKSLRSHCEYPLAQKFAGKMDRLREIVGQWGREISLPEEGVDFAATFQILPKLAIRVLWWDEDRAEGFQPRTKFLFDSRVLSVLDLESLLFTCEQITDRLLDAA